ncbi:hypothetical protein RB213_007870 [Colletotrichum asianum]
MPIDLGFYGGSSPRYSSNVQEQQIQGRASGVRETCLLEFEDDSPEHLNESQSNFDPLKRGISNYMEGFCALSEHTQHAALNNQGTSLVGEPELAWARSSCPAAGGTINTQLSRALKADGFLRPDSTAILAAERPIQNFDIESSATARTSIVDIFRDDISTIRGSMDWTNDAKTGLAFEKLPEP